MSTDLAPMRRAEELLARDESVDSILSELQMLFGCSYVDAMAAVAAVILLSENGLADTAGIPTLVARTADGLRHAKDARRPLPASRLPGRDRTGGRKRHSEPNRGPGPLRRMRPQVVADVRERFRHGR